MDCNNLLEIIDGLETEYIEFWKEVCSIESPSDCKEGVDKASACFIKKAKEWCEYNDISYES